jgi:hypothetical protein
MIPQEIKLIRTEDTFVIMAMDSEAGDNPELCRFDHDSDFTLKEVEPFLKAMVKLWNEQF